MAAERATKAAQEGRSSGGLAGAALARAGNGGVADEPTAGRASTTAGSSGALAGSGGAALGSGGAALGSGGTAASGSGGTAASGERRNRGIGERRFCRKRRQQRRRFWRGWRKQCGRQWRRAIQLSHRARADLSRDPARRFAQHLLHRPRRGEKRRISGVPRRGSEYEWATDGLLVQYRLWARHHGQLQPIRSGRQSKRAVACVDWCDAAAYCKWEGKHLCGRIDGVGSNPPASFADASKSAWYRACSHAGDFDLPYGNVYDGQKCIGLDNTAIHPVAVPHTDCEGGYSGLYDMSGNVAEWEDSCAADAAATDQCLTRGGSYLDTNQSVGSAPSLLCNSNVHGAPLAATKPRSTRDKEIGFRCCGDPVLSP